jgi:hypothetical protein
MEMVTEVAETEVHLVGMILDLLIIVPERETGMTMVLQALVPPIRQMDPLRMEQGTAQAPQALKVDRAQETGLPVLQADQVCLEMEGDLALAMGLVLTTEME